MCAIKNAWGSLQRVAWHFLISAIVKVELRLPFAGGFDINVERSRYGDFVVNSSDPSVPSSVCGLSRGVTKKRTGKRSVQTNGKPGKTIIIYVPWSFGIVLRLAIRKCAARKWAIAGNWRFNLFFIFLKNGDDADVANGESRSRGVPPAWAESLSEGIFFQHVYPR